MDLQWRIELFGGLRAIKGDRVVSRFLTRKTGSLLAYLAYHSRQRHPREVLIELLWAECALEAGRQSLSMALSSLRHELEPAGVVPGTVISADRMLVGLNPHAVTTDVMEFETALQSAAQTGDAARQVEWLSRALDLYQGELLRGYYEPWILSEQERLEEMHFQAAHQLLRHLEHRGEIQRAIHYARRAVMADPLREETHCALMRLLAADGQPLLALRHYRELRRLLKQELDTTPSAATVSLARKIESMSREEIGAGMGDPAANSQAPDPQPFPSGIPSLPAGTLTFLLAQIASDATAIEQAGEPFQQALKISQKLLQDEFLRYGGRQVETPEERCFVAFARATDALACAISGQQALRACPWPEAMGHMPVRMALHTSEIDNSPHCLTAIYGRARRILQAATGGQILCSKETAALLRSNLKPDLQMADLGLDSLEGPSERLFRIHYPE